LLITTSSRRRLLAVSVVAALALAACGSGDDDSAGDSATTEASATTAAETPATTAADTPATTAADTPATTVAEAAADKSPVLIGATVDLTGVTGRPEIGKVIEAWAAFVNENGGINGHPVELDIQDTKGDAAAAQAQTEELLAKNPVLFLLESSGTETAQGETLAASGVPVMGVGYNPAIWGGNIEAFKLACSPDAGSPLPCALPNAFPLATTFGAVVDEQVLGAQAAGATKLAVAACAEVDSCSAATPVFEATTAAVGLEFAGTVKVSSTAGDYSAECIQWIQDGVDFIQISGGSALGTALIASCNDQGYEGIFGASAGSVSGQMITIEGITMAGGLNAFPWWVDDPLVKEYRDVLAAAGVSDDGINDPTATGMWSALQLFAKANADLSDDPTAAETLANMYTIKDETLGGLIAPTTFTEGELAPHRPCFWPYVLEDGEFTNPLGGLNYQCYPAES
jgi:branched-chain amino acid transport system substrate-binding protein